MCRCQGYMEFDTLQRRLKRHALALARLHAARPPLGLDKPCRTGYGRITRGNADGVARGRLRVAGRQNGLHTLGGVDHLRDTLRKGVPMKASFFESIRYVTPQKMPSQWPLPPGCYDPEAGVQA